MGKYRWNKKLLYETNKPKRFNDYDTKKFCVVLKYFKLLLTLAFAVTGCV